MKVLSPVFGKMTSSSTVQCCPSENYFSPFKPHLNFTVAELFLLVFQYLAHDTGKACVSLWVMISLALQSHR